MNKNSDAAFCAVGADHTLEDINGLLKVSGGLIGITLHTSARNKLFHISPELARLTTDAQHMARLSPRKRTGLCCLVSWLYASPDKTSM